ncbi:precorrin-6A/cobalt-precorrin-6A reductase [Corynebacterium sp. A21]|uniref:precorrin-6A/cobalt-precorrin-6A reductase n=1 Tax=Corynebacterium sp. A21 TaxID=3457318 RepID=UPI003FD37019
MRALILGGTEPARLLATELDERGWHVTTNMPEGATYPPGVVRIGGFGGAAGMAAFLMQQQIQIIIDASHPFAEEATYDAAEASRATGVPVLALQHVLWEPREADCWTSVADTRAAADHCARHFNHILLDLDEGPTRDFSADPLNLYVIRGPRPSRTPARYRMLAGTGPRTLDTEKKLLRDNQIDGIVLRHVGDVSGQLTLDAARELRIPVVLIDRPRQPRVWGRVHSVEEAVNVLVARRRPDPEN